MVINIAIFILVLSLLVLIHEFGHFLAARKFGVKVLEFGFGLPPRLWGKKIGETIYSLNFLPFGGFVHLLGEDEATKKNLEDKHSFAKANIWVRILIVIAGVTMNLLLAWLLFYLVIIASDFKILLPTSQPMVIISKIQADSPANLANLTAGQRILKINNQTVSDPAQAVDVIKQNLDNDIRLTVSDWQGQNPTEITLTPRKNPPPGQGALGIVMGPVPFRSFDTTFEKIFSAPIYSFEYLTVALPAFGSLFQDIAAGNLTQASKQVAGPVGIVAISNDILQNGWESTIPYIYFVAIISLNLAVINIIPFPGLDGGRFFFLVIELVSKKRPHPALEKYLHTVGLVILIGLILLITASDIRKLIN